MTVRLACVRPITMHSYAKELGPVDELVKSVCCDLNNHICAMGECDVCTDKNISLNDHDPGLPCS